MTEKRFTDVWCSETGHIGITDKGIDKEFTGSKFKEFLNELSEENEQLQHDATILIQSNQDYRKKNEQLKQDNNALIHLLENQSMIIQELHSKLLEYQIQEPIVLTKEDLELMGKAISYYTHGRYAE